MLRQPYEKWAVFFYDNLRINIVLAAYFLYNGYRIA